MKKSSSKKKYLQKEKEQIKEIVSKNDTELENIQVNIWEFTSKKKKNKTKYLKLNYSLNLLK